MRRLFILAFVMLLAAAAHAGDRSDLEKRLRQEHKGDVVFLRHFYSGSDLRFDASGNKLRGSDPTSWTTDAEIKVTDLRLKGDTLEIKGRRLFLAYDAPKKTFYDVPGLKDDRAVTIILELPPGGRSDDAVRAVWKSVFLVTGEDLADFVPQLWQHFLRTRERPGPASPPQPLDTQQMGPVLQVKAGEVSPPGGIPTPDPGYSEWARAARLQGTAVFWLVVGPDGNTHDIQIVRALGLGLDEQAADAIAQWRLKPAEKDGKPVAVQINVEVNFQLFR